jgi:lipoate-protein ligase B
MRCVVYQLGPIEYRKAYRLQKELLLKRSEGQIPDVLLLLEHSPTITIGKSGRLENVLASPAQLAEKGIAVLFVDRGGDVTYHGPGQLVGYPIIDLGNRGRDIHRYVRDLEEVIIKTLGDFSIPATIDENHAGVWVQNEEIAAIGIAVKKWVSMHGFALNVNTDLEPFSLINPCGFSNRRATSMSEILPQNVSTAAVIERLLAHFSKVFDAQIALHSDGLIESTMREERG